MAIYGRVHSVVLGVCAIAGVASGQLATQITVTESATDLGGVSNSPLIAIVDAEREHGVELAIDANRVDTLRSTETTVLRGVPVDQGVSLDLDLTRFEVFSADAVIESWDGDEHQTLERSGVVLLQGTVVDNADSTVFLAISDTSVNGYIETGDTTYIISNGRHGTDDTIVAYNLTDLPEGAITFLDFACQTDAEHNVNVKPNISGGGTDTRDTCDVIELAIDTDYEFTNWLFGNDQTASTAYIETLVGATNTIYKRDVGAVFEISYLRLWSSNSDPYSGDVSDYLYQLQSMGYNGSLSGVDRDLFHVLSPTSGGGGVAWVDVICDTYYGYGASSGMGGYFPQPLGQSSQNWDIVVFPHELGHNCGTGHTHEDYNPPIDNCGNGNCAGASNGTLMSYCHLCSPGISNMNLEFHSRVQTKIEAAIGNSGCVGSASTPVFTQHPASQSVCIGDPVTITANVSASGTLSYQWLFNGSPIAGATSGSYSIASVDVSDFGVYRLEASTPCDFATSFAAIIDECANLACSEADVTTQGAGAGDPSYGVPDGAISASDINYFVNAWVSGDLAIADVTTQGAGVGDPGFGVPDGSVTASDINYYVNIWIQGCP